MYKGWRDKKDRVTKIVIDPWAKKIGGLSIKQRNIVSHRRHFTVSE
jgi:hypothetical protein